MSESLSTLLLAVAVFVGGHFLLSSLTVRRPLIRLVGEGGFRTGYSLFAAAALIWSAMAYSVATAQPVWSGPAWLAWLPLLVMPPALLLVVGGLSVRSVTAVGGEAAAQTTKDPAPGMLRVTRHPMLWGIGLWALSHMAANGDGASLIFFGGFAVLAFGGMAHIDYRRRQTLGGAWGPVALTTSVLPFAAIAAGRTRFDRAAISPARLAVTAVLYGLLLTVHPFLFAASPLPV
ncbi:MAG: NnrU family protein [Alphaproteobacteria bacterium]